MELANVADRKNKVNEIYNSYLKLLSPDQQSQTRERLQSLVDQMNTGVFQVVVMGEIKKGKSSFISALLGEYDLLPTDSDVATSTVYKIRYGDKRKYTVMFEPPDKEPEEIEQNQIPEYGTEKGNPNNEKKVAFIQIEIPNHLLKQGLVIVDTPGVGGMVKQHQKITFAHAPYANAVFFVIDSVESVLTMQEISFLKDLYQITEHVYFVQTKIDAVDTENWQAWKKRNIEILTQSQELSDFNLSREDIRYFPLSSKLKRFADEDPESDDAKYDLEDSGFVEFNRFIENELIGEQQLIIVQKALNSIVGDIQFTLQIEGENLENIKNNSEEEISVKENQINKILQNIKKWKDEEWSKVYEEFVYELSQLAAVSNQQIRIELGPDQETFKNKVEDIRNRYDSSSVLIDQAEKILNNYVSFCALSGKEATTQFLSDVEKAFYRISKKAMSELVSTSQYSNFSLGRVSLDLKDAFSLTGLVGDAVAGGVVGGALAGGMWWTLVGPAVAVGVVGPGGIPLVFGGALAAGPIGWAAIGAVGLLGAVGVGIGSNKLREKKKIQEVVNLLCQEMEKISNKAIMNFDEHIEIMVQTIKQQSTIIFEKIGEDARQDAETMLKELRNAKQLSAQEAAVEIKKRQDMIADLNKLQDELHELRSSKE